MPRLGSWAPEYLAAIVDSSDDAIIGKTLDGTIISWNKGAERIYGYTADQVLGRPISILIPADRPNELPSILSRIARGERIDHYLTKRARKDGQIIDISVTISPVQDETGRIVGASAIARDVTAQEGITKEALRIREEFISVAAHELRTPLTTMYARLQLVERRLARQELDPAIVLRDVNLVRQAADRLKLLIDRLLDVSRIRSGQLQLERDEADVAAMLESVVSMLADTSGREITLRAPDPPESNRVAVDAVRMEEVVVIRFGSPCATVGQASGQPSASASSNRSTVRRPAPARGLGSACTSPRRSSNCTEDRSPSRAPKTAEASSS